MSHTAAVSLPCCSVAVAVFLAAVLVACPRGWDDFHIVAEGGAGAGGMGGMAGGSGGQGGSCPDGQQLCGGDCVDTSVDDAHCGGCDMPCALTDECEAGTCLPTCETNLSNTFTITTQWLGLGTSALYRCTWTNEIR